MTGRLLHPPLSILQVGAFPFPLHQGSQVYAGGMCAALAARGHHVWLATYGQGTGALPEGVQCVGLPQGTPTASQRSGPSLHKPWLDLMLARSVATLLREHRFDVVHAHNVEAPFAVAVAQRLASVDVPWVYNLHTSLQEELPTYWPGLVGRTLAHTAGAAVDRLLARRADASVGISERAQRCLHGWGARRVVALPPGVCLDDLDGGDGERLRARHALGDGPFVLYTGNLDAYQDVDVLMTAMASVPQARLLVVTGEPTSTVHRLARSVDLPEERYVVVSSTDFADTRDALALADVAAVPRTVCAGFPVKLLNLLGAGVPTVVAQGSAQPIAGTVVVPDGDAAAMAEALCSLLADPAHREALSSAAMVDVAMNWTWDHQAEQLEAAYRSLV